ncbi:transcriptional regulator GutM [Anaerosalibacter massiliensis]|uniref:Transcriptional regulator GutM n=1 Tax=Anaerosalibacter massiliensis TaxID=1347392 RepID=A0A9X2MKY4_9FIRM|nr:transcriptional regulator GutM [Anaerosalibacter massiliensis]
MDNISKAMIFIFAMWILQGLFAYIQVRHFNNVIKDMKKEGKILVGQEKGKFSVGSIVILVLDNNDRVVAAKEMKGITVFNRFKNKNEFINKSIVELKEDISNIKNKATRKALKTAINQWTSI